MERRGRVSTSPGALSSPALSCTLEALAVENDPDEFEDGLDGCQIAARLPDNAPWNLDEQVIALQNYADNAFETIKIRGREYILVATGAGA